MGRPPTKRKAATRILPSRAAKAKKQKEDQGISDKDESGDEGPDEVVGTKTTGLEDEKDKEDKISKTSTEKDDQKKVVEGNDSQIDIVSGTEAENEKEKTVGDDKTTSSSKIKKMNTNYDKAEATSDSDFVDEEESHYKQTGWNEFSWDFVETVQNEHLHNTEEYRWENMLSDCHRKLYDKTIKKRIEELYESATGISEESMHDDIVVNSNYSGK